MTFRPPTARTERPARSVVALLLLALLLGGCGAADRRDGTERPAADPTPAGTGPATLEQETLGTTLRTGVVSGRLPRVARERTVRAVGRVVDGWIDAAYVGGTYPRGSFRHAFRGFTHGARVQARRDRGLLSNHGLGRRIDGVRPVRRVVLVDVLAAGGRAVGATARVRLGFRTTGPVERRVVVRARLALSRTDGWQVFGYDATTGSAA